VHEWHSIVVGLVTGLARVWNPESYGWVTGLGKVRTMDIRGRKKKRVSKSCMLSEGRPEIEHPQLPGSIIK
jgi:hypothetical protein